MACRPATTSKSISPAVRLGNRAGEDIGGGEVTEETPTEEVTEPPVDTRPEEVTEPSADTFSLSIFSVDENNNPLTGACFGVDGVGEQCDDDADSVVTFAGLQNGDYTNPRMKQPRRADTTAPIPRA